jgi:membrane associated rhomboid family serine protease
MAKGGAIEKSPGTSSLGTPNSKGVASAIVEEVKDHGKILGGTVALLWVIQAFNWMLGGTLAGLGVHPRDLGHWYGIFLMPFLHASWAHLIANTIPLVVLGWITMLRRKRDFFYVSAISGLISGLGVWLIGAAQSVHVGASGVIFGLLGYLLSRGIFERKVWPILGGLAALFLYGGALQGILPGTPGISWEGHLFGLIGGIFAARLLASSSEKKEEKAPKPQRTRIAASSDDKPRLTASKQAPVEDDTDVEAELEALRRRV